MSLLSVSLTLALYGGENLADYYSSRNLTSNPPTVLHEIGPEARLIGLPAAKILTTTAFTTADALLKSKKQKWILRVGSAVMYSVVVTHNEKVKSRGK